MPRDPSTRKNAEQDDVQWGQGARPPAMASHYAQTFCDPRQNAFEFSLVCEEPEEHCQSRESGEADDGVEAVSFDSNAFEDEPQTPAPKYDRESAQGEGEEDSAGEGGEEGRTERKAGQERQDGEKRSPGRKHSPQSTLRIETGRQAKGEGEVAPAAEGQAAAQGAAAETRSIFSRSFRSRKSTSVRSQAASAVFSAGRQSTGRQRSLGRGAAAQAQDIFESASQVSKSSARLHATAASTMANQRNLQRLGEMAGRRLQGDAKGTDGRRGPDQARSVTGGLGKQPPCRANGPTDRSLTGMVSRKHELQDAILSEQVKHAQQEALRRFIGQVVAQEYEDKQTAQAAKRNNDSLEHKQNTEWATRKMKELRVDNSRQEARHRKKVMLRTEVDFHRTVPDIAGNLGYPRMDHMTSSQELRKTKFEQKFFMGDLDHQLDLKQKRLAEEERKADTHYVL